ncbi:MAG: acyl-CoA dehydrogenase [bacterium]
MSLLVDERDLRFVLFEQLKIGDLVRAEAFRDHSEEVFQMVVSEAYRLAENVLAPANVDGDRIGAQFAAGEVKLPDSYHACYRAACEGGWICPADSVEVGGQGLPTSLATAAYEVFLAANVAFVLYLTLNHGAGKIIERHGTAEQKARYLEKLYTGQWAGTMCLTEPGAGSDLGALKSRAIRKPDGTYLIEGVKQFITAGDHDLTENIIYPVLARIEGDPAGSKGISLFLVSKYHVLPDGSLGGRNDVVCSGIEHKMGIRGSATCTLNFGENGRCVGELIGAERQGLPIMFVMMNEERLNVGLQGQAIGATAYLYALKFARERVQGTRIADGKGAEPAQVAIIEHPDVRRMLLWMKAYVEGIRALLYYTGYCIDREHAATAEKEKVRWSSIVELLTPICKAYASDMSYDVCEQAIQVHGGYGYCSEYPVEQFARDCKIASIYEGTNGIQALDLLTRKILRSKGQTVQWLFEEMMPIVERLRSHGVLGPYAQVVEKSFGWLRDAMQHLGALIGKGQLGAGFLEATPLLEVFGDVLTGWLLLWQAEIAQARYGAVLEEAAKDGTNESELIERNPQAAFLKGKVATAKFYIGRLLPITESKVSALKRVETAPLDIPDACF